MAMHISDAGYHLWHALPVAITHENVDARYTYLRDGFSIARTYLSLPVGSKCLAQLARLNFPTVLLRLNLKLLLLVWGTTGPCPQPSEPADES